MRNVHGGQEERGEAHGPREEPEERQQRDRPGRLGAAVGAESDGVRQALDRQEQKGKRREVCGDVR